MPLPDILHVLFSLPSPPSIKCYSASIECYCLLSHHLCWQRHYMRVGNTQTTPSVSLGLFAVMCVFFFKALKHEVITIQNGFLWQNSVLGASKSATVPTFDKYEHRLTLAFYCLSVDLRILWNVFRSFITARESQVRSCHHTSWSDWYLDFFTGCFRNKAKWMLRAVETMVIVTNNI